MSWSYGMSLNAVKVNFAWVQLEIGLSVCLKLCNYTWYCDCQCSNLSLLLHFGRIFKRCDVNCFSMVTSEIQLLQSWTDTLGNFCVGICYQKGQLLWHGNLRQDEISAVLVLSRHMGIVQKPDSVIIIYTAIYRYTNTRQTATNLLKWNQFSRTKETF
jgi:hypothetical protein